MMLVTRLLLVEREKNVGDVKLHSKYTRTSSSKLGRVNTGFSAQERPVLEREH